MAGYEEYFDQVRANLRRVKLSTQVVAEVKETLVDPLYPDNKADLLLAVEELAEESIALLLEVREMVWESQRD